MVGTLFHISLSHILLFIKQLFKNEKKKKDNILNLGALQKETADQIQLVEYSLLTPDNDNNSERTEVYEFGNLGYL